MSAYLYCNSLLTVFPASPLLTSHLCLMVYSLHSNLSAQSLGYTIKGPLSLGYTIPFPSYHSHLLNSWSSLQIYG